MEEQHLISNVSGADGGRIQGGTEKDLGGEKPEGHNWNLFYDSFGRQKAEIKVSAGPCYLQNL